MRETDEAGRSVKHDQINSSTIHPRAQQCNAAALFNRAIALAAPLRRVLQLSRSHTRKLSRRNSVVLMKQERRRPKRVEKDGNLNFGSTGPIAGADVSKKVLKFSIESSLNVFL